MKVLLAARSMYNVNLLFSWVFKFLLFWKHFSHGFVYMLLNSYEKNCCYCSYKPFIVKSIVGMVELARYTNNHHLGVALVIFHLEINLQASQFAYPLTTVVTIIDVFSQILMDSYL